MRRAFWGASKKARSPCHRFGWIGIGGESFMSRMSIKIAANAWRGLVAFATAGHGGYLWDDVDHWWRIRKLPPSVGRFAKLTYLLAEWREFRNVFDMRLKQRGASLLSRVAFRFFGRLNQLCISVRKILGLACSLSMALRRSYLLRVSDLTFG